MSPPKSSTPGESNCLSSIHQYTQPYVYDSPADDCVPVVLVPRVGLLKYCVLGQLLGESLAEARKVAQALLNLAIDSVRWM